MTIRSLNARLARLEQHIPEPRGPIEYRVLFHDGTPVWPGLDNDPSVPAEGGDIVYRIASWEEFGLDERRAGTAGNPSRSLSSMGSQPDQSRS